MTKEMKQFIKELGEFCAKHDVEIEKTDDSTGYYADYTWEAYMQSQHDTDHTMIRETCSINLPSIVDKDGALHCE